MFINARLVARSEKAVAGEALLVFFRVLEVACKDARPLGPVPVNIRHNPFFDLGELTEMTFISMSPRRRT
jgi:hypothetical protein